MDLQNISRGALSYSGLSTWEECPWKFKLLYADKAPKSGDSIYTMYGHLMHETLAQYLPLLRESKEDEFLDKATKYWNAAWVRDWKPEYVDPKFKLTEECYQRFLEDGLYMISNKLMDINYVLLKTFGEYEILNTEVDYTHDVDGVPLRGIVDLVIKTTKDIAILDYKSAKDKSKWRKPTALKMHQLNLYAMIYETMNPALKITQEAFLVIPRSRQDNMQLIVNNVPKIETLRWMHNIVWGIQNDIFYKNWNKSGCYMCEYNKTPYCNGTEEEEEKKT